MQLVEMSINEIEGDTKTRRKSLMRKLVHIPRKLYNFPVNTVIVQQKSYYLYRNRSYTFSRIDLSKGRVSYPVSPKVIL